jgi:hypothetical protein
MNPKQTREYTENELWSFMPFAILIGALKDDSDEYLLYGIRGMYIEVRFPSKQRMDKDIRIVTDLDRLASYTLIPEM